MATTFKDILDRAASTLWKDYKLDNLYKVDQKVFYGFLSNFLVNSCDMFDGCLTSLDYHVEMVTLPNGNQEEMYVFNNELNSKEIYILALGVCLGWFNMHILDVTQFETHLQGRDFKSYSEAKSLSVKTATYNSLNEEFTRQITKYELSNLNKLPFFGGD